ncbi:hypothetical protein RDWZM_010014 [Blomia tropicalis]|uniref:Uncharacterized protein n=1 Tax=Blomia tropicalis TaxID=40697 RepID=A0A9Q0RI98_BLOTA|nr:hypothetical protein BLOT_010108 [Blomia tropicalis]KAJ6215514.1 hypothetical protein RDWZM_010014 [Blomia tropicalis]
MSKERSHSDAIWISPSKKMDQSSSSSSFQSRFGFGRSMSVNSEGSSTVSSTSPPYSPIDNRFNGSRSNEQSSGRNRTSSFSGSYGTTSYDHYNQSFDSPFSSCNSNDPFCSPLSSSAPGPMFRRSNSISIGAMEHGKRLGGGAGGVGGNNLGPIEEMSRINSFGDAFKRSVGQLFNAPKMPPQSCSPPSKMTHSSKAEKKNGQMTDRVVSLLCENAIR